MDAGPYNDKTNNDLTSRAGLEADTAGALHIFMVPGSGSGLPGEASADLVGLTVTCTLLCIPEMRCICSC